MEYFRELSYPGIFIASFLAATILPLSSEIVLTALLLNGLDPYALVALATFGNVLGAFTNYAVGLWGGRAIIHKVLRTSPKELAKALKRFRKYGTASLLLAWAPVIGDPLTIVAGLVRVNLIAFTILVTLGKLARYIALSYVVLK